MALENMASDIYTLENPLFKSLLLYSGLLILKICFVTMLTVFLRTVKRVFVNPEDAFIFMADPSGKLKPITNDPHVERVRRIHLNDMENIFPFILVATKFLAIQPAPETCLLCFRIFTVGRFAHTFIYLFKVRQPARIFACGIPFTVILYMTFSIVYATLGSL